MSGSRLSITTPRYLPKYWLSSRCTRSLSAAAERVCSASIDILFPGSGRQHARTAVADLDRVGIHAGTHAAGTADSGDSPSKGSVPSRPTALRINSNCIS
jgi:hypothetical protein